MKPISEGINGVDGVREDILALKNSSVQLLKCNTSAELVD